MYTLRNIDRLENFNKWIYERICPYIGEKILEVGSGWGSFTKYFVSKKLLVGIDINKDYVERLKTLFIKQSNCIFINSDILKLSKNELRNFQIDTVIIMNVLEHIENDFEVVKLFYDILIEGGHIIVLVPAFNFLYGTLDRYLGHKRRYTRKTLSSICEETGFFIKKVFYFNFFSMFGWLLSGRILLRVRMSPLSIKVFNFLFPVFRFFEDHIHFPIGQSIILIGEKKY